MPFGIFNGTIFLIKSGFLTPLKLLWRYGLSLLRMERYVNKMLDKFVDIYTCQQKGLAYQTVPDLLGIMGEEYASLTKVITGVTSSSNSNYLGTNMLFNFYHTNRYQPENTWFLSLN